VAKANDESLIGGLEVRAATGSTGKTVYDLLEDHKGAIEKALPNVGITAERLIRVLQTQIRLNPAIGSCTKESLLGAVLYCAQLGLEPGPLGQAYLIPFGNVCTFVLGYKGMIALAHRGSGILISAYEVCQNDKFTFNYGDSTVQHTFVPGVVRGPIVAFWARAVMPSGSVALYVMDKGEVDAHRKRSKAGSSGPWVTDYAAMGRKTVIRVLAAQLPLEANAQRAVASDETPLVFDGVDDVIAAADQAPIDVEAIEETEEQEILNV
jgi:recombination protein RecT